MAAIVIVMTMGQNKKLMRHRCLVSLSGGGKVVASPCNCNLDLLESSSTQVKIKIKIKKKTVAHSHCALTAPEQAGK